MGRYGHDDSRIEAAFEKRLAREALIERFEKAMLAQDRDIHAEDYDTAFRQWCKWHAHDWCG